MKKRIIIIAIVVILLALLGLWQRNNLKALYMYITMDKEEVSKVIDESGKKLSEEIKKYEYASPRPLTPEEEEMIAKGEISIDEATEMLLNDDAKGNEAKETNESGTVDNLPSDSTGPSAPVKDEKKVKEGEIIKKYTATFYSMKAYYVGQLNQIESKAKSEYTAMTADEKKNLSKATFVGKYASYALSLQGECDDKVESLLGEMKKELKAVGGDLSVISTIKKAYESEKAARKAYYLNLVG